MIEVKTILNQNLVRKFNTDQAKSKIWFVLVLTGVFSLLGIIGLITDLWETFYSVFLIILGCVLPFIYLLTVKIMLERTVKSSPLLKSETTQIWRFLDDKIILNESGKYVEAHDSQLSYDAIYKVVEREGAFYVYLSKMQAYILDAKGFTMGSRHELHRMLLNKLGTKKVKYSKRLYAK